MSRHGIQPVGPHADIGLSSTWAMCQVVELAIRRDNYHWTIRHFAKIYFQSKSLIPDSLLLEKAKFIALEQSQSQGVHVRYEIYEFQTNRLLIGEISGYRGGDMT